MAKSKIQGMAFRGLVSCVPEREVLNDRDYPWFEPSEIRKVTAMVGVKSHRAVDENTCASDLCAAAGYKLLEMMGWDRGSVDGLILVTQSPDFVMPPTSCLLQHRLNLTDSCACFDINLGCSAYVYGLWVANALIAAGNCRRILLLAGDTPSKYINPKDRTTALLFGDAGTATALEWTEDASQCTNYIMMTDGKGANDLIVPAGGFRQRFTPEQSLCYVQMDGAHVFDFTRFRVPALISDMCEFAGESVDSYDYFIFHQANEYLIKFISSKAGIEMRKVPLFLGRYGNTSAASVPLTLSLAGLPKEEKASYLTMFLGFGVGLSWGAVSMSIRRACVLDHFVYSPEHHLAGAV